MTESRKYVQLGAQFCLIYLFHFFTCFGHPRAHHQEKMTVSMRQWYLSLSMGGVRSAGWIEKFQSNQQTGRHAYRVRNTTVA